MTVDENIGNQANNNNNDNVMMRLLDAAGDEYIDYQANDNESHDVVDAPVGDVPDNIGAIENIKNHEVNNNDNQDVVDAPVGNVTDRLFDVTANENIGIVANNEENHDVVGAPVDNVADIAEGAAVEIIAAAVETITDVREHEFERSLDITQINHQLQSINQQLRLKEEIIGVLEARIKDLENWRTTFISTMFPSCTSIGGENLFGTDSMSQVQIGENHDEEQKQEHLDLGEGFNGGKDKGEKT